MKRLASLLCTIAYLLLVSGCGGSSDAFRRAQEMIAAIERNNPSGVPDYTDARYDDVLAQLAEVPSDDANFWRAREWTQKIAAAREAAKNVDVGAAAVKAREEDPAQSTGDDSLATALSIPEPEAPDPLEWHESSRPADLELIAFHVQKKDSGVYANALVWNTSSRSFRIKATLTALSQDGVELAQTYGLTPGPMVGYNDRSQVSLVIGAYDPNEPVEYSVEPDTDGAAPPSFPQFDPEKASRYRLSFSTADDQPLSWFDARPDRKKND